MQLLKLKVNNLSIDLTMYVFSTIHSCNLEATESRGALKEWKPSTEDSGMIIYFDKTYSGLAGKSDKISLSRQTNSSCCIEEGGGGGNREKYFVGYGAR